LIPLSEATKDRIRRLFDGTECARVEDILLNTCGDNLPLVDTGYVQLAERIRFAVLKLSHGNIAALQSHIKDAQIDWRDVLVAADFAESTMAHLHWTP
jgi:hypothetical protein